MIFRILKSIEVSFKGTHPTLISVCFEMITKVFQQINTTFALPM